MSFDRAGRARRVGLVGESGCGKSTVARDRSSAWSRPTSGQRALRRPRPVDALGRTELRRSAPDMQMVFQDPYASLNPRMTVGDAPRRAAGGSIAGARRRAALGRGVRELLDRVGLRRRARRPLPARVLRRPAAAHRHRPRAGPATRADRLRRAGVRARRLRPGADPQPARRPAARPRARLPVHLPRPRRGAPRRRPGRRDVPRQDRRGRPEGRASTGSPSHPYTQALLSAAPSLDDWRDDERREIVLGGDVPSPLSPPSGCRFRTRCWQAQDRCREEEPVLIERDTDHPVACHFPAPS